MSAGEQSAVRYGMEFADRRNKQVRFDPLFLKQDDQRKKEKKVLVEYCSLRTFHSFNYYWRAIFRRKQVTT